MEELSKELIDKMKTYPKWLTEPTEKNEEGFFVWKVDCWGKEIEIKELNGSSYEAATAFADKMGWDEIKVITQRSIMNLKPSEIDNLRGRDYVRLKGAMAYVYGMNDF